MAYNHGKAEYKWKLWKEREEKILRDSGVTEDTIEAIRFYELEALRIIECLKKSRLEIKDIKQFFIWVSEGSSSYEKRKELFETRKSAVETEIQELQKTLFLLKFKCWYYETAMKDGNEDAINAMLPDKLPKNIQKLYDKGHD